MHKQLPIHEQMVRRRMTICESIRCYHELVVMRHYQHTGIRHNNSKVHRYLIDLELATPQGKWIVITRRGIDAIGQLKEDLGI